jgi:hypothetical protein
MMGCAETYDGMTTAAQQWMMLEKKLLGATKACNAATVIG